MINLFSIGIQIHECFVIIKNGEIVEFSFDDDECKISIKRCKVADFLIIGYYEYKRTYYACSACVMDVEGNARLIKVLIKNEVTIRL